MAWVILALVVFAGLHFLLWLPVPFAIAVAAILTGVLWLLWKLRWVILAVIGLEAIFGGRPDDNA